MSNKTKYYVIGSSLILAMGIGGQKMITGPSDEQIQATAVKEGFTPKPEIPVKGDVPTIGHGTTVYPNGVRVKMSDPAIDRKQAFEYLKLHMDKDAQRFNKTILNIPVSQGEYDLYLDFTYQYGTGAWSGSSMLRHLKAREYIKACKSLLKWKYVAKRDCSIRSNNCYGVWTRQVERYNKCMGVN
ncbi:glycoside hydrolase family protein [Acinetobacter sp. Ver3]|uniref:glycoside hydrolase family protein n=1 Tax=Acinetobacter sp. Ver3 TaxID=466088 RepID=UPI00044C6771|nr:glycoside hydrolase family protein [Acinetobacter sp. Ver3]EZQ12069.1 lysozyme [Acinetobacter sp. Ver3]